MQAPLRVLTKDSSHFFGFHDLTPWNPRGDQLVALHTDTTEDHVPVHGDVAQVVVIDEASGRTEAVGETEAWNWQQGARQHWLDDCRIIFNDRGPDGFVSRVVDIVHGGTQDLPLPINDLSPDRTVAIGIDFARLNRLYNAYGYATADAYQLRDPENDGLFIMDLTSGESELLLSIAEVSGTSFGDVQPHADFFTHPSFSPSGARICLLHRRIVAGGAMSTNLVVVDRANGTWKIVADDRVSHLDWEDEQTIVVWCRRNKAMSKLKRSPLFGLARALYGISKRLTSKRLRRSVYRESFRRIDVVDEINEPFGLGVLDEDGHPMVNPTHPDVWVNDTYPDENHVQTLMLYDAVTNRRLDLLSLPTPPAIAMTGWRCDLHPRWHPHGTRICIDSAHSGRRQICIVDARDALHSLAPE